MTLDRGEELRETPRDWPGVIRYTRRFRDGWRRRYWAECWICPRRVGPFRTVEEAAVVLAHECGPADVEG